MIAPRAIPVEYLRWNKRYGAPYGRRYIAARLVSRLVSSGLATKIKGPFSIQPNNTTRHFEYPWAFEAANLQPGHRVLEIGGGLSGFQFVLEKYGCKVVNVDPGLESSGIGWPCTSESIGRLNRLFGTSVELRNTTMAQASLMPDSFDRVFAISVLEHLSDEDISSSVQVAAQALKPGGIFVITVDLFLDLAPFTSRTYNQYGRNVNIKWIVNQTSLVMEQGNPAQLNGFSEFDSEEIESRLEEYFVGEYPALVQCLVLRKK